MVALLFVGCSSAPEPRPDLGISGGPRGRDAGGAADAMVGAGPDAAVSSLDAATSSPDAATAEAASGANPKLMRSDGDEFIT